MDEKMDEDFKDDCLDILLAEMSLKNKEFDLDDMEKLMNKFCKHRKNYLDFVLFTRNMVPYLQNQDPCIIFSKKILNLL